MDCCEQIISVATEVLKVIQQSRKVIALILLLSCVLSLLLQRVQINRVHAMRAFQPSFSSVALIAAVTAIAVSAGAHYKVMDACKVAREATQHLLW
ncbi:hypothetical protein A2G96_09630 [Cupriavidus nantongensis]|uniref:Uncharacterized protein n=1 Tax=Cupriavidus nantongensis TaxID=1796606 RepID=A0A142JIR7_9BURK|nr:hypothetical protein A2G96_09630 [Cupriavidus nantongensis]